jgi:hypothetical protein
MEGEAGRMGCHLYLAGMGEGVPTAFKVPRLMDPPGRDKMVVRESAQRRAWGTVHLIRLLACGTRSLLKV